MPLIFFIWFLVVILPVLIFLEGKEIFYKFMTRKGWWQYLPHFLIIILSIAIIILWLKGYR